MPLVKVEMIKGKSKEYKLEVLDCIHQALVETLNIKDWDQFQRIVEIEDEFFQRPDFKTNQFMIIELTLFPGRTKQQKADAIYQITELLNQRLSVPKSDIFIIINEPPLENWGMGGIQKGS